MKLNKCQSTLNPHSVHQVRHGSLEEGCWHEPDTILKFVAEYLISNSHPHCEIQLWPPESRQHAARYRACMHLNKFPQTSLKGIAKKLPNTLFCYNFNPSEVIIIPDGVLYHRSKSYLRAHLLQSHQHKFPFLPPPTLAAAD